MDGKATPVCQSVRQSKRRARGLPGDGRASRYFREYDSSSGIDVSIEFPVHRGSVASTRRRWRLDGASLPASNGSGGRHVDVVDVVDVCVDEVTEYLPVKRSRFHSVKKMARKPRFNSGERRDDIKLSITLRLPRSEILNPKFKFVPSSAFRLSEAFHFGVGKFRLS